MITPLQEVPPSPSRTSSVTFAEKFCAQYQIPPQRYEAEMLKRSLYFPGKAMRLLVGREANYFAPDRDFIRGVGRLTSPRGFGAEVWAFTIDPENSRFHRLHLKMRVSAKKVYRVVSEILENKASANDPGNSLRPF
jgi:hypothetical protein